MGEAMGTVYAREVVSILETRALTKTFGGLTAVNRVSFGVKKGEIRGLIGPNGSGKTTMVNLISGLYKATAGEIRFMGEPIDGLPPNLRTMRGMVRTFQIPKLFREMTVLENMLLPALAQTQRGERKHRGTLVERAEELLTFVNLLPAAGELARTLSGGQSMLLQIARGFMVRPLFLYLMDEPFAGVNPQIKGVILESIQRINQEQGVTFIIVSHEMPTIRRLCSKVSVMHEGRLIAEGSVEEVANNPTVIEAYLGG
jgi:branched-chain amino acid transport system ATP-binding protein